MPETLKSKCESHGVELDAANLEAVEAIGDGSLLKALFALVVKYGPAAVKIMPQVLALLAAGNWLGAMMLILSVINKPVPAPTV